MGNGNLKPFSKEHQPTNRKSRKGVPNRATVFKKWLETKINIDDPNTGKKVKVTLLEAAALGQIQSAMDGNTSAWKEIQDTLHGKLEDKVKAEVETKIIVEYADDGTD